MIFYKPPLKNKVAFYLSFFAGVLAVNTIALFIRVMDQDRLLQKAELESNTVSIDESIAKTQRSIQSNREEKLGKSAPIIQKEITTTQTIQTTPSSLVTNNSTPTPAPKKSDRTTKTS